MASSGCLIVKPGLPRAFPQPMTRHAASRCEHQPTKLKALTWRPIKPGKHTAGYATRPMEYATRTARYASDTTRSVILVQSDGAKLNGPARKAQAGPHVATCWYLLVVTEGRSSCCEQLRERGGCSQHSGYQYDPYLRSAVTSRNHHLPPPAGAACPRLPQQGDKQGMVQRRQR
jgi:hypothetical protein